MARKSVVKVLMERDGISEDEVHNLVNICRQRCMEAIDEGCIDCDEIIEDELGLEPDYLDEILF